jgi:predicted transcriptional regulator
VESRDPGRFIRDPRGARQAHTRSHTAHTDQLDTHCPDTYAEAVEVHFTRGLEAKLTHLATAQGRKTDELCKTLVARYLEAESWFLEAVEKGIAAAGRGEFIDEEEMDARVEQMFKS